MGNTCYYGLTREACQREDFVNISCCSPSSQFGSYLSVSGYSLSQQWTCGETEQSVKEPCGGECPRSTDQGYYIGSRQSGALSLVGKIEIVLELVESFLELKYFHGIATPALLGGA